MAAGSRSLPGISCIVSAVIIGILLIAVLAVMGTGHPGTAGQTMEARCAGQEPAGAQQPVPVSLPPACPAGTAAPAIGPAIPDSVAAADLVLEKPPAEDLVPYTARNFSPASEAAVAWWMSPAFMDNTSEFRTYERSDGNKRLTYPEEHRIFFSFIEDGLDQAELASVLKDRVVLFRGIGPSLAASVLNSTQYREPAFASTSYDITLSLGGFSPRSADGYRNILVLERDAGEHAVYINEDEREFLLPRGTRWHVVKTVNVENLTVRAGFPLWSRTTGTGSFDHVRLISIAEDTCA